MAAPVDVCNMALSHLAVSTPVRDLETDRTPIAAACRLFYPQARDEALRDFVWPFATRSGALGLVASDPTTEWAYAYRLPAGCLAFRRILTGSTRLDTHAGRVPFRLSGDDAGTLIYTDQANAVGEWTTRVEDLLRWPPDAVEALSLLLATLIAPRVTAGDQFKLGARAFQLYQFRIATAQANAANDEQPDPPRDSDFIVAREG